MRRSLLYALIAAVGAAGFFFLIAFLPTRLVELDLSGRTSQLTPAELADAKNSVRTTLLQATAGIVLVAGAIATWRSIHVNRETQVTERYTRAIDQLGSDKANVRLGGIFALERIARDSPLDHRAVMEVLAAFLRGNSRWDRDAFQHDPHGYPKSHWPERFPAEFQAALTILATRDVTRDPMGWELDLYQANLARANLAGANLRKAFMIGVNLQHAWLPDARLDGAWLRDSNLYRARLQRANLEGAHLEWANLEAAELEGARLKDARYNGHTIWPSDDFNPPAAGAIWDDGED